MANTVDKFPSGTVVITEIPQTGSDVAFTFQASTNRALIWAGAGATTNLYFAAASAGHVPILLPVIGTATPLEIRLPELGGLAVTFNGTNATNVFVIESLTHSIP